MSGIKQKKALIAEDEPAIRDMCKRVVSNEGLVADVVGDGKSAQKLVQKQQYDLLLVDIRMPEMGGIEFYDWLQKEYPPLSKHVIFMTGSVTGGEIITFLERSGQPYLLKPFRPNELLEVVRGILKEEEK